MKERIDFLFERYIHQSCSDEEMAELNQLLADPANSQRFRELIGEEMEAGEPVYSLSAREADEVFDNMISRPEQLYIEKRSARKWWMAAATLLLMIGTAYLLLKPRQAPTVAKVIINDVPAGKNGAILTLANGSSIVLDSVGNGLVTVQGSSQVVMNNGQLAYHTLGPVKSAGVQYNKLSTPRGRQFDLVLPDGTHVWLNAASSLRYPAEFNGSAREVDITGEVYFEVAAAYDQQQHKLPFIVHVNNETSIQVLGTHFNVNAYTDEAQMKTTLLEGAVRINNTVTLKPGQQAAITKGAIKVTDNANTAQAVAWKDGIFYFAGRTGVADVLRQLSRWYDVEVIYEHGIPAMVFTGKMQRDLSLSQALKGLADMGVNFRIEENRLYVNP